MLFVFRSVVLFLAVIAVMLVLNQMLYVHDLEKQRSILRFFSHGRFLNVSVQTLYQSRMLRSGESNLTFHETIMSRHNRKFTDLSNNLSTKLRSEDMITILMYPNDHIDGWWGSGAAERRARVGNRCSQKCRYILDPHEKFDAVFFTFGKPGCCDSYVKTFWSKFKSSARPPTAIWYGEKDDDRHRAELDKKNFDVRLSYSFKPDIFHTQACGGLLSMQTEVEKRTRNSNWLQVQFHRNKTIAGAVSNCNSPFRNRSLYRELDETYSG